jgi:hypothetical protein
MTAPSIVSAWLEKEVYYKIPNLYRYRGMIRDYIQGAIYGGRVMTRDNKKWLPLDDNKKDVPLDDFDGVSLYPSAMARCYIYQGKPKVLTQFDKAYLDTLDYYICDITVNSVKNHFHFPLPIKADKNGRKNTDDDKVFPLKMRVDKIFYEDLIEFQGADITVNRGCYWNEGKDARIQKKIRWLFNQRKELKKAGNPL